MQLIPLAILDRAFAQECRTMARTFLWLLVTCAVATAQHVPNYNYPTYDYNYASYGYQGQQHDVYIRSSDQDQSAETIETIRAEEDPRDVIFEESFGGIVPSDVLLTFDQEPTFFADLLEPPVLTANETAPVELESERVNVTSNETEETAHERSKRQILSPLLSQLNQQTAFVNPNLQQQFDFVQQLPAGLQLGQFQFQDPVQLQLQQQLLQSQQFLQQPTVQDQLFQQAQAANHFGSLPLAQQQFTVADLGQQTAFRASPATGSSVPLNSFQTGSTLTQNFQDSRLTGAVPQSQQELFGGIPVVQNNIPLTQGNVPVLQQNLPLFQNSFASQTPQVSNVQRNQNVPLSQQGTGQNQAAASQLFQQQGDAESQFSRNFFQNQNAQTLSNNAQFVQSVPQQQGFFGQVNSQSSFAAGTATGGVPRFGFQPTNNGGFPSSQPQSGNTAGLPSTQQQQQQQQRQQSVPQFPGQFPGQQNLNSGFNPQVQQQGPKQPQQQNASSVETNGAAINKTKSGEQATSTESAKVARDSNGQQATGPRDDNLRPPVTGSIPLGFGQTGQSFAQRGATPTQFGSNTARVDPASFQSANDPQRQQQQPFQTKPGTNFQGFGGLPSQGFGQLPSSFVFVPNAGQPGKGGQDQPQSERVARSADNYQGYQGGHGGNYGYSKGEAGSKYSNPSYGDYYGKPIAGSIYPVDPANNQMFTFIGGIK